MGNQPSDERAAARLIRRLETFIEKRLRALKSAWRGGGKETLFETVPAPKRTAPTSTPKAAKRAAKKPKRSRPPSTKVVAARAVEQLLQLVRQHPSGPRLLAAGKQKNQLLRSLIPLYLAQGKFEVSSGATTTFWAHHQVTFAAPNAAKALRQHPGYAQRTAQGPKITSKGVQYVEKALGAEQG